MPIILVKLEHNVHKTLILFKLRPGNEYFVFKKFLKLKKKLNKNQKMAIFVILAKILLKIVQNFG
jgi:hypothetical protein